MAQTTSDSDAHHPPKTGPLRLWTTIPLYVRILFALALGLIAGIAFGKQTEGLKEISSLILSFLKALATPLIFLAILHALLQANISGRAGKKMVFLLVTNTMAAITIGLLVANVVQPGKWGGEGILQQHTTAVTREAYDPASDFKNKLPTNIVKPLYDDNVIAVVIMGLAFGLALRKVRQEQEAVGKTGYQTVMQLVETVFTMVMTVLHWVIEIIPIAVFCVVASVVGSKGFGPFKLLAGFIVAVLVALALQAVFYMTRVRLGSWVSPGRFLSGGKDALFTAFSTASSTAAMPVTFAGLRQKVGLREESASLGALVGSNFNNDGTALYEAMAPLFIAQALPNFHLAFGQQIVVALMAVVASVGAAGIPEAGLVTMLLVFKSVHLPVEYVLLLLPVDWFLDRCRTAINVMGDMSVACLIDGKKPEESSQ